MTGSRSGSTGVPRSPSTQLGARGYDPGLGRFLTVDPKLDTADPRHANAYAYSFNSPVSFSDADGLVPYNPGPPIYQAPKGPSVATSLPAPIIVSVPPSGAPPSAGNGGNGGGSPAPAQEVQWWNPGSWDQNAWVTAGEAALTIGAVIAVGACVVATAGICAGVGMVGGLVLAGAASGTISLAGYELKTGPKTGEGALTAFNVGGLSGVTSFGIGFAAPVVMNAAGNALKTLVSTAGTKTAPAIESAAATVTREVPTSAAQAISVPKTVVPAPNSGIYVVNSSNGVYVGQSGNITRRLAEHVNSGKFTQAEVDTAARQGVTGGKTQREIAEQLMLDQIGRVGDVGILNRVNPIGPARFSLMPNQPYSR